LLRKPYSNPCTTIGIRNDCDDYERKT
jgi:hypothetical protein